MMTQSYIDNVVNYQQIRGTTNLSTHTSMFLISTTSICDEFWIKEDADFFRLFTTIKHYYIYELWTYEFFFI